MSVYEFTLKTVTPLFISGADQEKAELRATSFKGLMRFWFRAMMGGVVGNNPQELYKEEGKVFGSTEVAAPFILTLEEEKLGEIKGEDISKSVKKGGLGLSYFGYPLSEREGFNKEAVFKLRMIPRLKPESKVINLALGSLWLLIFLGGVGYRGRRGFGALKLSCLVKGLEDREELPNFYFEGDFQEFKGFLERGLTKLKVLFEEGKGISPWKGEPSFPILKKDFCGIYLLRKRRRERWGWEANLQEIERAFREYRGNLKPSLRSLERAGEGEVYPEEAKRLIFGLPLRFYRKEDQEVETEGGIELRRASPLFIKLIEIGGEKCFLLSIFKSEFLSKEKEAELKVSWGKMRREREDKKEKKIPIPDTKKVLYLKPPLNYDPIVKFIEKFVREKDFEKERINLPW